ncbi:ATP-binding cassette domain-containing protein [Candidatus Bathyarchaeota archaeon]|nr:ATP-binding cassette domain-containing protein [Candidatus Bathyarchaeota archaeon]
MNDLRRTFRYLIPYTQEAVTAVVLLGLVVITDLSIPRLVQIIIDEGVANNDLDIIIRTSFLMIGASILSAIFMVANTVFAVRVSRSFEADLRESIFKKIQTFSFGNLDDFNTGQLLTRLTSDINQIQMIVTMSLRMFTRAPLMFIGSLGIMYATNVRLANTVILILPVTVVLVFIFVRVVQPLFTQVQERLEYLNQVLQENLVGIRVVKAFVRRGHENRRFEEANQELYNKSVRVAQLLGIFFPMIMTLLNLGTVAVIYYGGIQVIRGTATVGQILAFNNYLFSTMFPVLMLSMMAGQISAANASATRIMQVLDSEPEVLDSPNAITLENMKGRVEFRDVKFSYGEDGGDPVLSNMSFTAEPGQTVAILGATGSGKSTMIYLIPRFYDVKGGSILIDGIDVRDLSMEYLRSNIGMSLQEAVLFSGTIRENIRYGRPDAPDEEVIEAAKAAQAHEFITGFPSGYDSIVGQRGVNLSGGQKQRIAIARALLVRPKILILDDSTSSVDVETEIKIENALENLMKDRTSFVIAQRISTVLNADKILVLESGKIAAEGTHGELMQSSPIYKEIYDSQLGLGVITQ